MKKATGTGQEANRLRILQESCIRTNTAILSEAAWTMGKVEIGIKAVANDGRCTIRWPITLNGVQATAISPIAAEELFDGIVALRHGTTTGLDPVDVVSRYYVEALDGVVLPPRVSNDRIRQTYWEDELARTGEREYSVAVLEIPQIEAKLCFKGDRRDEVELQVAEAVRRIHPEEESLYTAIATHDLVLSRGYAKGRPDDAMIAQITDASGQSGFVLGKDSHCLLYTSPSPRD